VTILELREKIVLVHVNAAESIAILTLIVALSGRRLVFGAGNNLYMSTQKPRRTVKSTPHDISESRDENRTLKLQFPFAVAENQLRSTVDVQLVL
jgi:hypothetical protein